MSRVALLSLLIVLPAFAGGVLAQQAEIFDNPAQTRTALERAQAEAAAADARGRRLEAEARNATEQAEKTAREAAALAARIQQAEAGIAAADARIALINGQRQQLDRRLAQRREPLVRLTAALQKLARRPLVLSALRPGSLRETVYLRAMLETTIPQVRGRTAALRAEIGRSEQLEDEARQALGALRSGERQLAQRRTRLATIETRQRLASRQASGDADREVERALALAEEARDLDTLIARLNAAGSLRKELAALPGPIIRPARPEASQVLGEGIPGAVPAATNNGGTALRFQLPVNGRIITGFGAAGDSGQRNEGISLLPRPGALVVAPANGRVVFAGPYRGYDRIVILEHDGGWTSLVTGLARTDVTVGQQLVTGAPLGIVGPIRPVVNLELRRAGQPVNPVEYLR